MTARPPCPFATEAELVVCWLEELKSRKAGADWTVYPETAGWDLLLVHRDGYQIGIEAKLTLNVKVLAQALEGANSGWREEGPDYRAVLIPRRGGLQRDLEPLCRALGIGIIKAQPHDHGGIYNLGLPDESGYSGSDWPNWLPAKRCALPDYVPDVAAGVASPVKLTHWKIKAIKLMILLERRGVVTRADMKALQISPTRWTDPYNGILERDPGRGGFVAGARTPDFRAQHPVNFGEIEADFATWCPPGYRFASDQASSRS